MTTRCIPKSTAPASGVSAFGRQYSGAAGTITDVPDGDAQVLGANGFIVIGGGPASTVIGVGTTAQRPTAHPDGRRLEAGPLYIDTSLSKVIVFDGVAWRSVLDGSAV